MGELTERRPLSRRGALQVHVGSLGLLIHLSILEIFHFFDGAAFSLGQVVATLSAMMFNFFLNNLVTFRELRCKCDRDLAAHPRVL